MAHFLDCENCCVDRNSKMKEKMNPKHIQLLESMYGKPHEPLRTDVLKKLAQIVKFDFQDIGFPQEAGGSVPLTDRDQNTIDFDVHQEFPNGQTLLHLAAFEPGFCRALLFMKKIGLDFSKPDKFGRTPLYYALVSHETMCYMLCHKIFRLIFSGATLNRPLADDHLYSCPRFAIIIYIHSGILMDEFFSYEDSNINDVIKCLITADLKENVSDDIKWSRYQKEIRRLVLYRAREDVGIERFKIFYGHVKQVCSEFGFKCKLLLKDSSQSRDFFQEICQNVEILKFLNSKGVALDKTCTADANYLDLAIRHLAFDSVVFLTSIGVRPSKLLSTLISENCSNSLKMKLLVEESCQTPASLQNLSRLRVNEFLNVENALKNVPQSIGEFIKFVR